MKKNFIEQVSLFLGLLLFSLSLFKPLPVIVVASFVVSLVALIFHRKKHPRVDKNFKKSHLK